MYGIKVWLSEDTKDWYLLRDMDDGVVHVWDKRKMLLIFKKISNVKNLQLLKSCQTQY